MIDKDPKIVEKILRSENYQKLVTAIFNLIYEVVVEEEKAKDVSKEVKTESSPNRAYNIPEGTCYLVHRLDKRQIFIAKRKVNYSTPNCVCISDFDREQFFADLREHGIKKGKGLYAINEAADASLYANYCDKMKYFFKEQL